MIENVDELRSTLIVCAHPDDEVLGAGGLASVLSQRKEDVSVCILSGNVDARRQRPSDDDLLADLHAATSSLGLKTPILGSFPNIRMNTIAHIEMVSFIERALKQTGASIVVTHHPADVNDDHRQVSLACQAAARLAQRGGRVAKLDALLYMEVPSSTDWAFVGSGRSFEPNSFVELGEEHLERKLEAIAMYRDVMRPYPHPRSVESIRSLAAHRGAMSGMLYAEAFQVAYLNLTGRC